MHGTVMMFLFAIPALRRWRCCCLPEMLGTRDLPFRGSGPLGSGSISSAALGHHRQLFFGLAPDGGWFMYPPLTGRRFSPGIGADFWLLGISFIEISAIATAIEVIVTVLRTVRPGMSLARMPIFAWTMLVFAVMIVIAFPPMILATLMLEVERAFGWPFFDRRKRRRPAAVAASVLVLRTPRGLHHLPAGGRHGLDDRADDGAARRCVGYG